MKLIVILGPTASGKTALAARLAFELEGEIISADSRQVYRGMDIGTGKDLKDYLIEGMQIPVHLVDIVNPGYEYNIYEFKRDFARVYQEISSRGKQPLLCGGSGMYLESVLKGYELKPASADSRLLASLETKSREELSALLLSLRIPHNTTDLTDRVRMIRAITISLASSPAHNDHTEHPKIDSIIFGISLEPEVLRQRINSRLEERLQTGMVEEVQKLLDSGVTPAQLKFYGLEYRYITMFIEKEIDYQTMFRLLSIAIHQFAKRQRTWFRRMERQGFNIQWIDGNFPLEEKLVLIKTTLIGLS
ncbi:MAG: tRNA (adenosine(37)-N6)-dimethylallyltransferase MiaA [Bacteroidota bacterium]